MPNKPALPVEKSGILKFEVVLQPPALKVRGTTMALKPMKMMIKPKGR